MWRACHNILPTYEKLRQHRIIENDLCPICNRVPETILHELWECAPAQDMWAGCFHRLLRKGLTVQISMLRLIEDLLHKLPLDMLEFFLVLCWLLWNHCNRVVHCGILQDPGTLIGHARSLLVEYLKARTHLELPVFPVTIGLSQQWQPPVGSMYKLNFDAAVFNDISASGVGMVIRNSDGQVMAAMSSKGPAVMDSEEAEILACRRALEFAIDAGFADLVMEGDNSNVMQSIASAQSD